MITFEQLERFQLTPEQLRPKFTPEGKAFEGKLKTLLDLLCSRSRDGRDSNLSQWRTWWAIDLAYDAPFRQITPTLMHGALRSLKAGKSKEALEILNDRPMTNALASRVTEEKSEKELDLPTFNEIIIPLVRAYLNIRWSKLFADRDLHPLLKYEPAKSTRQDRIRAEIITDRVRFMSDQLGYRATLRQMIFHALHYGTMLAFPAEDWFTEIAKEIGENNSIEDRIVKEGLRYNIPHPSRTFYDDRYRLGTINTNTGVEFLGYWRVVRFSEIEDNDDFFNKDSVSKNTGSILPKGDILRRQICPCTINLPSCDDNGLVARSGAGENDRESRVGFFSTEDRDQGVVLTDHFMRLTPKQWGLGSYDAPIWMRFVLANDDTPLYVAPILYTPAVYMGYDAHEERKNPASLSLELLPFQDHMSNLLSQQILSAKKNLAQAVFVNSDLVSQQHIEELQNLGEKWYRSIPFIPFSGRKVRMSQQDIREAFHTVKFPLFNTVELLGAFRTLLDMVERVLVFSAQEVGAVAAHEQTAEEVRVIGNNVTNRIALTGGFIDDGISAWKKQLYDGLMAYGQDMVYSQIATVHPVTAEALEEVGFTVARAAANEGENAEIEGPKKALLLEGFASSRDADDRTSNAEVAVSMSQILIQLMSNPITATAIGSEQAIALTNQIIRIAGLPRDFQLRVTNLERTRQLEQGEQGQGGDAFRQQLAQLAEEIRAAAAGDAQEIVQQTVAPVAEAVAGQQQALETVPVLQSALVEISQRLEQLVRSANENSLGRLEQSGPGQAREVVSLGSV